MEDITPLLKQMIKNQEKTNDFLSNLLDLFKKYEIDEVLHSEYLRED